MNFIRNVFLPNAVFTWVLLHLSACFVMILMMVMLTGVIYIKKHFLFSIFVYICYYTLACCQCVCVSATSITR